MELWEGMKTLPRANQKIKNLSFCYGVHKETAIIDTDQHHHHYQRHRDKIEKYVLQYSN